MMQDADTRNRYATRILSAFRRAAGLLFSSRRAPAAHWGALLMLMGLAGLFLWGAGAQHTQEALAEQVLRLHVVANSDSPEDQALKLQVRDRILSELPALLADQSEMEAARAALLVSLPALNAAGSDETRRRGYDYPVTAMVGEYDFPTRDYGSFALPAGQYTALRIVIGDGGGENWWCVLFPPLCMSAVSTSAEAAALGLDDSAASLITPKDDGEYELRFKSVELWERFKQTIAG